MMRQQQLRQYGFTLVELLVTAASVLIMGAVLGTLFLLMTNTHQVLTNHTSVTNQLQNSLEQLERDIHHARSRWEANCGIYTYASGGLILDAPAIVTNGPTTYNFVVYKNNSGQLERLLLDACPPVAPVSTPRVLTYDRVSVANLVFSPGPPPAAARFVQTDLTLQRGTGSSQSSGRVIVFNRLRGQ